MIREKLVVSATLLLAASLSWQANASTFDFTFGNAGLSGTVQLTYGPATDAKYPQAFEATGISGTFSAHSELGGPDIVNAPIVSLVPLMRVKSEDPLAPHDFSRSDRIAGWEPHMGLVYDNLFYPGGAPQIASDWRIVGGFFDINGLAFNVGGVGPVNLVGYGDYTRTGTGPIEYGVLVTGGAISIEADGVFLTPAPEPSALGLFGSGLLAMLVWRWRAARQRSL